jgi:hypothetical protein
MPCLHERARSLVGAWCNPLLTEDGVVGRAPAAVLTAVNRHLVAVIGGGSQPCLADVPSVASLEDHLEGRVVVCDRQNRRHQRKRSPNGRLGT